MASIQEVCIEGFITFDPSVFKDYGWTIVDKHVLQPLNYNIITQTIQHNGSEFSLQLLLKGKGSRTRYMNDCWENDRFYMFISDESIEGVTVSDYKDNMSHLFSKSHENDDYLLRAMKWILNQTHPEPVGSKTKAAVRT